MPTGTYTVADLLANRTVSSAIVADFGPDALVEPLQQALAIHNAQVSAIVAEFAGETEERFGVFGVAVDAEMQDVDEFGQGVTQKNNAWGKVEYPLRKKQYAMGWTNDYFQRATVKDMVERQMGAQRGHVKALRDGIRDALFGATNYVFRDRFDDGRDLTVRRLANGDGEPIPDGPNGEKFDGATHNHYRATTATSGAGLATALDALIETVVEHGHGGEVRLYINRANAAAVQELPKFKALLPVAIVAGIQNDHARGALDITRTDNREIGFYDGFPVWTKPWVPADYYVCNAAGSVAKPLKMRVPKQQSLRGLRRVAQYGNHPLHTEHLEALFGFGGWTRTAAAVLYANAGNGGVYSPPQF